MDDKQIQEKNQIIETSQSLIIKIMSINMVKMQHYILHDRIVDNLDITFVEVQSNYDSIHEVVMKYQLSSFQLSQLNIIIHSIN